MAPADPPLAALDPCECASTSLSCAARVFATGEQCDTGCDVCPAASASIILNAACTRLQPGAALPRFTARQWHALC